MIISIVTFLLNLGLFAIKEQKSSSETYQAKKREEWLRKVPLPQNAIELQLNFSFPSGDLTDKDIYLYGARFVSNDSSGNLYLSDSRANRIFKFDSSGNFLLQFGRKGQGPGEFNYGPFNIMVTKNSIIANETGRIQFFDWNGKYLKSYKINKMYREMVINNDGLIFASPTRKQTHLVEVISQEGDILYSFGKLKEFKQGKSALNNVKLALNQDGELFVAFVHFPIIRKYSTKGELLAEFRIEHKAIQTQEEINQKRISSLTKAKTGYVIIISAIKAAEDGIYILHTVPRVKISKLDNNGEFKSIYWYLKPYGYHVTDFLAHGRGNAICFYVLQASPENKIEVFKIKRDASTQTPNVLAYSD